MKIQYTRQSLRDLRTISDYVRDLNPTAASQLAWRIRERIFRLLDFPEAAPRTDSVRRLVVAGTPYVVTYRIDPEAIVILTVRHGAQRNAAPFPDD